MEFSRSDGIKGRQLNVSGNIGCDGGSISNTQESILPLSKEAKLLIKLLKVSYSLRDCLRNGGITFGKMNKTLEDAANVMEEVEQHLEKLL